MRIAGEMFLVVNTALTAFSLYLSARMLRKKVRPRLLLASLLSSVYALWALVSGDPILLSVPACVLCAFFSTLLAFSKENAYDRFRLCAYALGSGLLLSGLSGFFYSHGMNAALAVCSAAMLVMLGSILLRAPSPSRYHCTHVEIGFGGHLMRVSAILDSGNLLTDPITNLPVIVVSRHALFPLMPFTAFDSYDQLPFGFRYISVRTTAGRSLMPLFSPDSLRVEIEGQWQEVRGVVAIAPSDYRGIHALVPVALFEGGL